MGSKALIIRQWLRDLFGSRLTSHLEEELMRTRSDYEARILEKERVISDLREQVAQLSGKIDRYEMVIIPMTSPIGSYFGPKKDHPPLQHIPSMEPTWEEIRADWDKRQDEMIAHPPK